MPESPPEASHSSPAAPADHAATRSKPFLQGQSVILILALITLIGLAFRLHLLGKLTITLDESDSVFFTRVSWREFLAAIRYGESTMTMTLFFVLLRGWAHLGDSEFVLRCLPVLFGVATIPAVYQLGNRFLSRNAGLAGAALLAAHSCHIRFSQQLRSYSLLLLFATVSTYFFLAAVESPQRKEIWAAYALTSALAIYAHTFALLVLVPQWLSLTPSLLRRIGLVRLFWIAAAFGVLLLPTVAQILLCSHCGEGFEWIPRPTVDVFLLAVQNVTGSYTWISRPTAGGYAFLVPYAGLWILAALGMICFGGPDSRRPTENVAVRLLILWLIFPFAALLGFPVFSPFSHPKYFFEPHYMIVCVPAAVLLAGQGICVLGRASSRQRWIFPAALFFMLALSVEGVAGYYAGLSSYSRDHDWRPVTRYILARQQPGDAALFPRRGYRPYLYYVHRELSSKSITDAPPVAYPVNVADALANPYLNAKKIDLATGPYKRIWLVFSLENSDEMEQAALIRSALEADFHLVGEQDLPGEGIPNMRIALFARNP